ncbi:MAG: MotA/TolQ/ExbB proton channel family protein [Pseudomonadales bacterium]|nr:MotA/TolQ/ExbB proton channel family protein [Pseudomonadales bacterium]
MNFFAKSSAAIVFTFVCFSFFSPLVVSAEAAKNLDELLRKVESGRIQENKENKAREKKFIASKNQQQQMLNVMILQQKKQEKISKGLEAKFEENDADLADAEKRLKERMGSLGELFGHITSTAGDVRSNMETSMISLHYPNREKAIKELIDTTSSGTELPSIEQIERLWFEMQREMTEQGKVVRFTADVARSSGTQQEQVIRVGVFNMLTSDGEYMQFKDGSLSVLARQPEGKYTSAAADLATGATAYQKVGIDPTGPTGGSLLAALIDSPTIIERWHQGGLVGYVITAVGVVAMVLAVWRLIVLGTVGARVNAQLKSTTADEKNPLGRVLLAAQKNTKADVETLELKMNEAILKELPALTSYEAILKIIAAVAPLLGLLGTVTGMILTFQAITIYGAGDPKAMAGGISSALITTVLGLIVAIPTVLMHTIVAGRSKHIIHVLEEQAAGIVAEHQEG